MSTISYHGRRFGVTCFLFIGYVRYPAMVIKPRNRESLVSGKAVLNSVMYMQ